jgi:pimeloyl-ACP methyl ester carboxylesterase
VRENVFSGADGLRLVYRRLGAGPTLVCHPGGPGAPAGYLEDVGGLERSRTLIELDPRGAGESERPSDGIYELESNVDDLEALRSQLGVDHLDLLGHSFGGFVSILYAAAHPDRVRRLVLVGTLVRFSDEVRAATGSAPRQGLDQENIWPELARGFTDESAGRSWAERRRSDPPWNFEVREYFNTKVAPRFDLRAAYATIRSPTLVLYGADEPFAAAAGELRALRPEIPVELIPEAGHFCWIEQPEPFRRLVSAFLDG